MSKDVFVDKNDDVITCIGIHSIASVEAWSCFPYRYGDEKRMNPDLRTLRMAIHAPFWKPDTANGSPLVAPRRYMCYLR